MFFSISKTVKNNYSHQYKLGNFCIGTDAGWQETDVSDKHVLYKGYADGDKLESLLPKIVSSSTPTLTGNFCVLVYDATNNTLTIKADVWRSFPIYVDDLEITNLTRYNRQVWADSIATVNADLSVNLTEHDLVSELDSSPLSHERGIDLIDTILTNKTKSFLSHNQLPIKAFMSGGVDSALVYSYLSKHTSDFTHVTYNHVDWDEFWMKNSGTLQQNWAYKQIHHWREDCILTTGSPGDEFTLRSPSTANQYLFAHGTSILELNTSESNLHYSYFKQKKHVDLFEEQERTRHRFAKLPPKHLNKHLCNTLLNDFQHWHLGKTLTWTPLRDLNILTTILRMPFSSVKGQILNSEISKELMERNSPGLYNVISDQKNTGNALKNLYEYYSSIDAM